MNTEGKTMKALTKKMTIAMLAVLTTATLSFAGFHGEGKVNWVEVQQHLRGLAACYQMCPHN